MKDVVKEFIQNDFTPGNLSSEAIKLLNDDSYREKMKESFNRVSQILGSKNASAEAAKLVTNSAGL